MGGLSLFIFSYNIYTRWSIDKHQSYQKHEESQIFSASPISNDDRNRSKYECGPRGRQDRGNTTGQNDYGRKTRATTVSMGVKARASVTCKRAKQDGTTTRRTRCKKKKKKKQNDQPHRGRRPFFLTILASFWQLLCSMILSKNLVLAAGGADRDEAPAARTRGGVPSSSSSSSSSITPSSGSDTMSSSTITNVLPSVVSSASKLGVSVAM